VENERSVIEAILGVLFIYSCSAVAQLAMQVAGMQLDDYIPPIRRQQNIKP
jgi:hypothetical protein